MYNNGHDSRARIESNGKVVSVKRRESQERDGTADKHKFQSECCNNECGTSGRLKSLYFASMEQTLVAPPRIPSFNKGRASRCRDIACTINMCHSA
jgi:hypothetical protein